MSGWANDPEETHPLKSVESYGRAVPEKRPTDNNDGATPLLSPQPPSLGFVYSQATEPSTTGNPYATQPPYNPTFKPAKNGLADQPIQDADQITKDDAAVEMENTMARRSPKEDGCPQCCGITVVVLVMIIVLVVVIYFGVKHPQLARVAHTVIKESQKAHHDGEPLSKSLVPALTGLKRVLNSTLTTTVKPAQIDDDEPWVDDDDLIPVFYN